jgi:S1-C subfamily serine protease
MPVSFTHLLGPKKGRSEQFDADQISVGRAANNMLSFGDDARRVSSHHAEVVRRGDGYLLRDLGSTNGTMINGRRVVASELNHDDMIEFGAGGPLVRFAIEAGQTDDGHDIAAPSRAATLKSRPDPKRRANGVLIGAITVAMLLGAWGGVMLSSQARRSDPEALSFSEIAGLNGAAVVFIRVEYESITGDGRTVPVAARTGSGFVISPDGLVITNRHLVRDWEYNDSSPTAPGQATRIEVYFPNRSRTQAVPASVEKLSASKETDVAILRINSENSPFINGIGPDLQRINQGDEAAVIGYPLGLELLDLTNDKTIAPSLSTGVVSRVSHDFIQLQLRAYRGNSGGPVFNRRGEVIGIVTANVTSAEEITLATPISAALDIIRNR